jgi:hypothetical protein
MTVGQLRRKHLELFAEESRSNHKEFLFKRLAWHMQAVAEGGLSERAQRRAIEIANDPTSGFARRRMCLRASRCLHSLTLL